MKKSDKKFDWTEEADATFLQLKKVLSTLPVLVAPKEREPRPGGEHGASGRTK
jgi:hypothetical protein